MTETHQVRCPFCDSADTELFSLFGQQLLTVQYYCNACRTPFERVRGEDVLADAARRECGDRAAPAAEAPPASPQTDAR
jgi:DNA-directed RNA polymerase subunit RPC12/RpoP